MWLAKASNENLSCDVECAQSNYEDAPAKSSARTMSGMNLKLSFASSRTTVDPRQTVALALGGFRVCPVVDGEQFSALMKRTYRKSAQR